MFAKRFQAQRIFTIRGAILLAAGTLLVIIAIAQNDLAASVLGPTLVVVSLLAALTWWSGTRTTKKLSASFTMRQSGLGRQSTLGLSSNTGSLYSRLPVSASAILSGAIIPPTFTLKFQPIFNDNKSILSQPFAAISVGSMGERHLQGIFPHRGNWVLTGIDFEISDRFGITNYHGAVSQSLTSQFRVEPQRELLAWPIISSVERSGDTVQISTERLGARLDLKTYHPADGTRSIAWKIFARRGELLARHPEAAATPDGTVIIFVGALTADDDVAGAAVAYAQRCEELGSKVIAGAIGSSRIVSSSHELLDLVIESAFNATAQRLVSDFSNFVTTVTSLAAGGTIKRIAIALPKHVSPEVSAALEHCAMAMRNAQIAITALIVNSPNNQHSASENISSQITSWFFETRPTSNQESKVNGLLSIDLASRAVTLGFEIGA